jgi:hypothetical protein
MHVSRQPGMRIVHRLMHRLDASTLCHQVSRKREITSLSTTALNTHHHYHIHLNESESDFKHPIINSHSNRIKVYHKKKSNSH